MQISEEVMQINSTMLDFYTKILDQRIYENDLTNLNEESRYTA